MLEEEIQNTPPIRFRVLNSTVELKIRQVFLVDWWKREEKGENKAYFLAGESTKIMAGKWVGDPDGC